MDSNSADSETFYCSFVSNEYIICECGDNLATEDALKVHLDNNHDVSEKEVIQEEPKLPKRTKIVYIVKKNQIKKLETVVFELPTEEHSSTEEVEVKEELKQELFELPAIEPDSAPDSPATPDPEETSLQEDAPEATTVAYPNLVNLEHNYDKDNAPAEFFCDFCGKSFASQRSVSIHMTRVHRPPFQKDVRTDGQASLGRKAVCEQCGKKYPSNAALRYHQRTHTGEKPYECSVCPKKFTMPLFLQLHLRTHTGERPYECALCPKAFSCQAAIQRHLRVHTGEKPYECAECGKAFSQSNSRKLHVHTVHRKLPTPYKSRARRNKATRKAAEAVVADDVMTLHYDDDVNVKAEEFTSQECELVYDNDVYDE